MWLSVLWAGLAAAQVNYSPKHHIAYEANGFDEPSERYIEKRAAKIERKNGAAVAADFVFQSDRLRELGAWLDQKWDERAAAWSKCYNVADVDPRRFRVVIEAGTFTLPQYPELSEVWGTVDLSVTRIRVTAWAYITRRGWVVNAIDTAGWEFGNALMLLKRGPASSVAAEIGDGDPCKGG